VLEKAEAALDLITLFVGTGIVRNDDLAGPVGRDDRCGPHPGDDRAQGVAVIGLVGKDGVAGLAVKQGRRLSDVVGLPSRDDEAERATERIQRLIFGPPFPLAAC